MNVFRKYDLFGKVKTLVETLFEKHGRCVYKHAWKVVFGSVLVNALFGLCLVSLTLNNNIDELYLARNTETDKLTTELLKYFPDRSADNFSRHSSVKLPLYVDLIVSTISTGNILSDEVNEELEKLITNVNNITIATSSNSHVTYETVCANRGNKCVVAGPHVSILQNRFQLDAKFSEDWLGGVRKSYDSVISARYMKLRFYLRQETESSKHDSEQWQNKFKDEMYKFQSPKIEIVFSHSRSFLDELGEDTYSDIKYFALVFTIFITYCGFLISGGDCVSKRMHLGRMGTIVVPLSVLGAWGFLSGIGQTFTNMVGVMPYFAMFHEVNNMLITLSALSENFEDTRGVDRVGKALRASGIPITITMVTHVTAFATTICSDFLAVEIFSKYTVATLLCVYINHMTFFVACLAIHERRIDANRHFCTCQTVTSADDPGNVQRGCCFRCCCTGRKPASSEQTESSMQRLTRKLFSKSILLLPVKILIILVLLGILGTSAWILKSIDVDTFKEEHVTTESYFSKFHRVDSQYFSDNAVVTVVVTGVFSFTKHNVVNALLRQFEEMKQLPYIKSNESLFWLEEYTQSPYFKNTSDELFVNALADTFLPNNPVYVNDIVFDPDKKTIHVFRLYAHIYHVQNSRSMIQIKEKCNDVFGDALDGDMFDEEFSSYTNDKRHKVEVHIHSPNFRLSDSINAPLYEWLKFSAVDTALPALLFVILGNNIFVSLQIVVWYCACIVVILGLTTMFSISFTSVTMIILIVGGSYSLEVIVYTYYSFMSSHGTDKASRTHLVLMNTAPVLFNTTFGTVCGLLVLLVEKSYVFITVFKVLTISSGVACISSFAFIPTVVSFIGPSNHDSLNGRLVTQMCLVSTVFSEQISAKTNIGYDNFGRDVSDEGMHSHPNEDVRL